MTKKKLKFLIIFIYAITFPFTVYSVIPTPKLQSLIEQNTNFTYLHGIYKSHSFYQSPQETINTGIKNKKPMFRFYTNTGMLKECRANSDRKKVNYSFKEHRIQSGKLISTVSGVDLPKKPSFKKLSNTHWKYFEKNDHGVANHVFEIVENPSNLNLDELFLNKCKSLLKVSL